VSPICTHLDRIELTDLPLHASAAAMFGRAPAWPMPDWSAQ